MRLVREKRREERREEREEKEETGGTEGSGTGPERAERRRKSPIQSGGREAKMITRIED